MGGHRLIRQPRKLNIKGGGKQNVVGCECGAIGMAATLVQRMAWHAEHVRQQPSPVTAARDDVGELLRRVAAVSGGN